jgi:hypothetical protein
METEYTSVTNADGSVAVCASSKGMSMAFVDGGGSIWDTDILTIVVLWSLLVLLGAFFMGKWSLKRLWLGDRIGLIVPPLILMAVYYITPWLQFAVARWYRTVRIGAASYGFITWDVPGWLAPVIGLLTYAITVAIGRKCTQPTNPPSSSPRETQGSKR